MGADCCADAAIAPSKKSEAIGDRLQRAMRYYTICVLGQSNPMERSERHTIIAGLRGTERRRRELVVGGPPNRQERMSTRRPWDFGSGYRQPFCEPYMAARSDFYHCRDFGRQSPARTGATADRRTVSSFADIWRRPVAQCYCAEPESEAWPSTGAADARQLARPANLCEGDEMRATARILLFLLAGIIGAQDRGIGWPLRIAPPIPHPFTFSEPHPRWMLGAPVSASAEPDSSGPSSQASPNPRIRLAFLPRSGRPSRRRSWDRG